MTGVLLRREGGQKSSDHVKIEADIGVMLSHAKECPVLAET